MVEASSVIVGTRVDAQPILTTFGPAMEALQSTILGSAAEAHLKMHPLVPDTGRFCAGRTSELGYGILAAAVGPDARNAQAA